MTQEKNNRREFPIPGGRALPPTQGAALLAAAVLLATHTAILRADEDPPPSPSSEPPVHIEVNPSPQPPVAGNPGTAQPVDEDELAAKDPYWRETVERAVEEYESDNPEVRRSATMLLGKYPVPPARQVIGRALEDPDAGVRQAALVSILEEQGRIYPPFVPKLLELLADPDVSIRRIASNSLRMVIHTFPLVTQPGSPQMQRQLPEETRGILREAFRDDDVSVRRNMVQNYPFLRITLPEETVVSLLHDDDEEVAVHTLRWGLQLLSAETLSDEINTLVQNEDPTFRLELARAFQSRLSPEAVEALEILQNDEHPPVALEAMLGLFNHRQTPGLYERMLEVYRETGGRSDAGQRLIFAAQMLGDAGKPFLREWLEDSNPAHRQQAAQVYLNRFGQEVETDFLLSLLDDPVQGVRQQAVRALSRSTGRLEAKHVRQLVSSRHVDVRRSAASLAAKLSPESAEDLLLDLLLDDVRDVRSAALQHIGQRRIEGWEEIMSISLREEDPVIQKTALDWLMRHTTPETLNVLRDYHEDNPNSPLRQHIEAHLESHGRPEATANEENKEAPQS